MISQTAEYALRAMVFLAMRSSAACKFQNYLSHFLQNYLSHLATPKILWRGTLQAPALTPLLTVAAIR